MIRAKLEQAAAILNELDIDLWMIFTRESSGVHDPCLDLVVGADVVWNAAFLVSRTGERVAVMGSLDTGPHERRGYFDEVIGYVQGITAPLLEQLDRFAPRQIAIDWSLEDEMSDGLTHGQFLLLKKILKGSPFEDRLISAEPIVSRLRGRKIAAEVERIERACAETVDLFEQLHARLRVGLTEREIAAIITEIRLAKGLECAWVEEMCPAVFTGPDAQRGHNGPSDRAMEPGHIMSVDFGMRWPGDGVATMEEVVVVEADGARFLSKPQEEILLVGSR